MLFNIGIISSDETRAKIGPRRDVPRGPRHDVLWIGSLKETRIVHQHNPDHLDPEQGRNRRKINPAQIWHKPADRPVDRLKDTLKRIPDLANQRLADIQNLKTDQPTHDEQ